MPFLAISLKDPSRYVPVDEKILATHLCPYVGDLKRINLSQGFIWHSNLVESSAQETLKFPKAHNHESNAAWGEIEIRGTQLHFRTDPLGMLPLWVWQQKDFIAVASELKAFQCLISHELEWLPESSLLEIRRRHPTESRYKNVIRVTPGDTGTLDTENCKFQTTAGFRVDMTPNPDRDGASAREHLKAALMRSAREVPDSQISTFLSGGIDSSVAACLLKQKIPHFRTLTLGTELGNEYAEAQEVAAHCGLQSDQCELGKDRLLESWKKIIWQNEVYDGLTAEILCQLDALCQAIEQKEKQALTGYGADLLFGGMLRHQAYMTATGVHDNPSLIERTSWSFEFSPFFYWSRGVRLFHLYWHPEVLQAALSIPLEMNFEGPTDKVQLRTLAVEQNWLPRPMAFRKKIGMTNGTSVHVLLSQALGLAADYAYAEKSKLALDHLKTGSRL